MSDILINFYYVEVKAKSEKRFKKVIFFSKSVLECEKFIAEKKEKGKVYRIVDSFNNLKSKLIC